MKKTRLKKNKSLLAKVIAREKEKKPVLNKILQEAFIRFLEHHPANRFRKNLRRMLLEHLLYDGARESIFIYDTLVDLDGLFELLDVAEEEWRKSA
jgi:hypothetical protein